MPREIIHWAVLEEVEKKLSGFPEVQRILKENKPESYLGALAHDAPYYHNFSGSEFEKVSQYLHGNNREDTFQPIRDLTSYILVCEDNRDLLWAFLFGMISHLVADNVFHPMIYYLTGNYYDKDPNQQKASRARHRIIEVYLDSYFRKKNSFWNSYSIRKAYVQSDTDSILKMLEIVLSSTDGRSWKSSFKYLYLMQIAFFSKPLGAIFSTLNYLLPNRIEGIQALFSFGRTKAEKVFERPLEFKNPISGQSFSCTVDELFWESVDRLSEILKVFEPALRGKSSDILERLTEIKGNSLEFDFYAASPKDAEYFSDYGLNLAKLKMSDWEKK